MPRKKPLSFEDRLNRLEELVECLQQGDITLEESLNYYKEAMELTILCSKQLEEAEKEVVLLQKNSDGKLIEKSFQIQEKENEL